MINIVADSGFDVLRIPVTWNTGENIYRRVGPGPDYALNMTFMARLEEVVNWGLDNGMYVIINSHTWDHLVNLTDRDYEFESARFAKIWEQVAEYFKDYGDHLIFEVMNEPIYQNNGNNEDWTGKPEYYNNLNRLNQLLLDTIRATGGNNEIRFIMLPTYGALSGMTQMNAFVLPNDMYPNKLIASIHAYIPYNFALNTNVSLNQWGTDADKRELDTLFANINRVFVSKGIPVIMGEFGAMNKNNDAIRKEWARYYIAGARQYGIPCVWWDNTNFNAAGAQNFGMFDRATLTWRFPLVLQGLMEGLNTAKIPMNLSLDPVYNSQTGNWQIAAKLKNIDRTEIVYSGSADFISPYGCITVESLTYENLAYGEEIVMYFDINPSYEYDTAQIVMNFNWTAYDEVNDILYAGSDPTILKFGVVTAAHTAYPIVINGDLSKDIWNKSAEK